MKLRTRLALGLGGVSLVAAGGLLIAALAVLAQTNAQRRESLERQSSETVRRNREATERLLHGMSEGLDDQLARTELPGGALVVRAAASGDGRAQKRLLDVLREEAARRQLDVIDVITPEGRVLASAHWPESSLTRTDVAAARREDKTGYALVQTPTASGAAFDEENRPAWKVAFARTARLSVAPELLLVTGVFAEDEQRLLSLAGDPEHVSLSAGGRERVARRLRDPFVPPPEVASPSGSMLVFEESQPLLPSFDEPEDETRTVTLRIERADDDAIARQRILLAFLAISALLLAACFPAAQMLSRRFAAPIDALAEGARAIASGDLDHRIPAPPGGPKDEVGELVGAFNSMARDLKESRAKLLQTERVAAWREIAKRIAHEIKNPLTPIQLAVETTRRAHRDKRPEFDEILEESARAILEEVESLKKLVKEFSEFARMPDPVLVPDDVNEVVRGALRVFTGVPDGIALDAELADGLPRVKLDRDQMTRVLINLVANAVDAVQGGGGAGTGRVVVRTVPTKDERGEGVDLHVVDDGPGIAPDVREKIFTPYFTTKPNGTGLGLAIVQRIVIDHGGEIVLAAAPGRGTDVVVRLRAPLEPATRGLEAFPKSA